MCWLEGGVWGGVCVMEWGVLPTGAGDVQHSVEGDWGVHRRVGMVALLLPAANTCEDRACGSFRGMTNYVLMCIALQAPQPFS
jgi:hypothetical protein